MRKLFILIILTLLVWQSYAQAPTVAATNVVFGTKTCSAVDVSWTNGDGGSRIVIASKDAATSVVPTNNTFYLANASFGSGHFFSATEFVVYNGNGSSVSVSNLEPNTTYYFSVFEYNGGGTVFNYLTTSYPEASSTTESFAIDFSISDPFQCLSANSFTFTPTVTRSGSDALSYFWRFGDGTTSTDATPTYTYPAKGLYDVSLRVSSTGCQATTIKPDTVAPNPSVSFTLDTDIIGNTAEQCFLNQDGTQNYFKFTNTSSPDFLPTGISNSEFTWYYGDGTFEIGPDNNFIDKTYSEPGTYMVKLVVDNDFNGIELCSDSFEMALTVKPRPIDTLLVELDTLMCLNNNLFDFDHNTMDGTVVSTWNFGDGNSSTGNNVSHSYSSIGLYYITLEAIDGAGCYDIYEDSVQVLPQPNNVFGVLNASYCEGDTTALVPLLDNGVWLGDGMDANGRFTADALGLNTVRYAVDIDGCKDTATQSTTVYRVPEFELGMDTSICSGTSYEKSILGEGTSILWSTGGTDTFTQVTADGVLWAQRSENGCTFRDSMMVRVIDAPIFELGSDSTLCGGSFRDVDVSAPEANYEWSDGFEGGRRTLSVSGEYKVTTTNKCGTYTDSVTLDFLPFACDIFVPNAFTPNGDKLNDVFQATGNIVIQSMIIYNKWGELLYESYADTFGWDGMQNSIPAKSDTYFYVIRYEKPVENVVETLTASGGVFLMR